MHRIAHAAGDVLYGGGEVLLEVDRVIEQAIVGVDLLFLRDDLLLKRGGEKLVGVLLRMNLEQCGGIDLAEQRIGALLAESVEKVSESRLDSLVSNACSLVRIVPRVASVFVVVVCASSAVAY